jgi:hypothetical protein
MKIVQARSWMLGCWLQEPASAGFRQWIKGHQDSHRERNRKPIAKLNFLGVEITWKKCRCWAGTGGRTSPRSC